MKIIRPIRLSDAAQFSELSEESSVGMTNLPKSHQKQKLRIEQSVHSFSVSVDTPDQELYFFVLEDLTTKKLGGISGIFSRTGTLEPNYFYRIETTKRPKSRLPSPVELQTLCLVRYTNGPSEVIALYVRPEFRTGGYGRLLSLGRFLFIGSFLERFEKITIAEMRGLTDENQESPFWDGLGRHFLNLNFKEVALNRDEICESAFDLFPENPIYIPLLANEAQKSIGAVHPHTKPALNMLLLEGFVFMGEVDLFDGGPKLESITNQIRTVRESKIAKVQKTVEQVIEGPNYIVSNNRLDFRACQTTLQIVSDDEVVLASDAAKALKLSPGEEVRYVLASPHAQIITRGG